MSETREHPQIQVLKQQFADELQSLITARVSQSESLWHYEHRQPQGIKTVVEYSK